MRLAATLLTLTLSLLPSLALSATAFAEREKLREPKEVRAENGVAKLTLHAKTATVAIGDTTVRNAVSDASYIPPTVRVARGESGERSVLQLRIRWRAVLCRRVRWQSCV